MSGKQVKHDSPQGKWNTPKESKNTGDKTSNIIKREKNIQEGTAKEIVDTVLDGVHQFADIAIKVLREELWEIGYLGKSADNDNGASGYYTYRIYKEARGKAGEETIGIKITKECTFTICMLPSGREDRETFQYVVEWLDSKGLMAEMDTIKWFLSKETPPSSTSKFKKENYFGEENVDDWLKDYEKGI